MPGFSGKFEYRAPAGGAVIQGGACQLSFDAERLTLVSQGPSIAFDLGDINVFRPGDYDLVLSLYSGQDVRLLQFGKSFQNLARELLEAYRDRLVRCLLVSDLDEVARFPGRVRLDNSNRTCQGPAELRLYESNLAVLPDGTAGFQWRLSEIDEVSFDEPSYNAVVCRGAERLVVGHLARRSAEFVEDLRSRLATARERAAGALHALFPFLSPEEFRLAAGLLREGASVASRSLRGIHRLIEPTLLDKVVDRAQRPYLAALMQRSAPGSWFCGFKIVRHDPDAAPADDQGDTVAPDVGLADEPAAEAAAPGGGGEVNPAISRTADGLDILYWFFFPLAGGAGGAASHVAWEATSTGGRATYLFRVNASATLDDEVGAMTRGLVALNFRREPVYFPSDVLDADIRYRHYAIALRNVPELGRVRAAFAGRAIHRTLAGWQHQVDGFLGQGR